MLIYSDATTLILSVRQHHRPQIPPWTPGDDEPWREPGPVPPPGPWPGNDTAIITTGPEAGQVPPEPGWPPPVIPNGPSLPQDQP